MKQAVVFILLSCFYYGSSANLIQGYKADSCEGEIFPKPPCCGVGKESAARIIDGTKVEINEFPWVVFLGGCGGSLINSQWVLSAAHCSIDPDTAYLGTLKCSKGICKEYAMKIKIKKVIRHEEYRGYDNGFYHDIKLLKLEEPVTFSDAIRPICLPTAADQHLEGKKAVVAGWGITNDGDFSPDLLKTTIEIWNPKECAEFKMITGNLPLSSKYQICAGGKSNTGCFGDSGGPLFLKFNDKKNSESYYQIGIVTGGENICGIIGSPQVFVNVTNYLDWIETTILKNQDN